MNLNHANIINALTLIVIGIWGAWTSASWTAKIPIGFGCVLLGLYPWVNNYKKWAITMAAIVSLGFALSLIMPALRMFDELNYLGVMRIFIMIMVGFWASYILFKSIPRLSQLSSKDPD